MDFSSYQSDLFLIVFIFIFGFIYFGVVAMRSKDIYPSLKQRIKAMLALWFVYAVFWGIAALSVISLTS